MQKLYSNSSIENASLFNFDIYADSLSEIILYNENKTPFTIAINGKWGSGKTTLMNALKEKLKPFQSDEQTRKVKTVWFNAWKYSECDSMFAALISEILNEMERQGFLSKVKITYFFGLRRLKLAKVASSTANFISAGQINPEFENWVGKKAYEDKISFYDIFQDIMEKIIKTFVLEKTDKTIDKIIDFIKNFGHEKTDDINIDKKGSLVIFIDDLDRCSPKNIADVLESINLFLDLEGCIFIIGTDISIITKAIEAKYNNIEDFSGIDYIRKMIHLRFDLPLLQEHDIESFMKTKLEEINPELVKYTDIIIKGLKGTPGEIIRFLDTFNFIRNLGVSSESKGYKEELLIKWTILSFSSPTFIDEIKTKKDFLVEVQKIARMEVSDRKGTIKNLKEVTGKEKHYLYCQNEKIISVLSSGEDEFDQDNIETYLCLSNIVPKEIKEESPQNPTGDTEISVTL